MRGLETFLSLNSFCRRVFQRSLEDCVMRQNRQWSDQEDSLLWALWKEGLSIQRLAVRFKRTKRAIEVRLARLRQEQPTASTRSTSGPP